MGGCDKADLSGKVMCCAGKVQVIVLGGLFMFFALVTGGLLAWQVEDFKTRYGDAHLKTQAQSQTTSKPEDMNQMYIVMALPAVMIVSSLLLFAMLKINPKLMLVICTIWPIISSGIPGYACYEVYSLYRKIEEDAKKANMTGLEIVNKLEFYFLYIIVGGSAIYGLCAIYCIVLLICLGCCQRAGAGKEVDLYSLESENGDDSESTTKSHISIE